MDAIHAQTLMQGRDCLDERSVILLTCSQTPGSHWVGTLVSCINCGLFRDTFTGFNYLMVLNYHFPDSFIKFGHYSINQTPEELDDSLYWPHVHPSLGFFAHYCEHISKTLISSSRWISRLLSKQMIGFSGLLTRQCFNVRTGPSEKPRPGSVLAWGRSG